MSCGSVPACVDHWREPLPSHGRALDVADVLACGVAGNVPQPAGPNRSGLAFNRNTPAAAEPDTVRKVGVHWVKTRIGTPGHGLLSAVARAACRRGQRIAAASSCTQTLCQRVGYLSHLQVSRVPLTHVANFAVTWTRSESSAGSCVGRIDEVRQQDYLLGQGQRGPGQPRCPAIAASGAGLPFAAKRLSMGSAQC